MKKIILIITYVLLFANVIYADYFDGPDWSDYYYNQGIEPDYADGDLEDKLGDSGYYGDLFPEEVAEDYKFNEDAYHNNQYITDEDMYQDKDGKIKMIPDLDYIIGDEDYKQIYPNENKNKNNNSGKTDYNHPIVDSVTYSNGYTPKVGDTQYNITYSYTPSYGPMKIGDKYYFKKANGQFKTGWYQENEDWYYFDLNTAALVINELREINNRVYYFQTDGKMAHNTTVTLGGVNVIINEKGECRVE